MAGIVSVVIADDHGLVRRGTREILQQDPSIVIVGEASNAAELLDVVDRTVPDVAVVDIAMPDMSGIEALERIVRDAPDVSVLVLTVHDDVEYLWRALLAGASGYLVKDVSDQDLIDAVLTVGRGGTVLPQHLTGKLMNRVRREAGQDLRGEEALTGRETEVLRLAARGDSTRDIAEMLSISPRTVEVHLSRIYRKLGANSRTKAVVVAFERGLVSVGDDDV